MKIYLVQHGEAMEKEENPERPLTPKGRHDAEAVAEFLARAGIRVEEVLHSGKTRARETAGIFQTRLCPEAPAREHEQLAPNDPVRGWQLAFDGQEFDTMLVGHLPHLSRLANMLLTGKEKPEFLQFQRAGVVCLECCEQRWAVRWMVVPELLEKP
ncbi:MAG: phosphohistidine phosphatase SixA [Candidatus Hydrogenedentes bacterium]|nr:phosphohistidine phosphatase SixA [Candidatus Hydrogenedentota bacterium]